MTNAILAGGVRLAGLPATPCKQASQTDSGNRREAGVPYRDPRDVAHNPRKEPMPTLEYQQTATAAARVDRASRDRLEAIEQAAREYLRSRAGGVPWPDVHKARERLRLLLNEPPPPPPLVKPWA